MLRTFIFKNKYYFCSCYKFSYRYNLYSKISMKNFLLFFYFIIFYFIIFILLFFNCVCGLYSSLTMFVSNSPLDSFVSLNRFTQSYAFAIIIMKKNLLFLFYYFYSIIFIFIIFILLFFLFYF